MIGLALVTLVATLASGIIKPFKDAVDQLFVADYAITAQNNFDPIPPSAARAAARVPGVTRSQAFVGRRRCPHGHTTVIKVTGAEPQTSKVIALDWQDGSAFDDRPPRCERRRHQQGLRQGSRSRVGSPIVVVTPTGQMLPLVIKGIFDPPTGVRLSARDHLEHDLRLALATAAQPLHVHHDAGRRHGRQHEGAHRVAEGLPQREGSDAAAVQGQPDRGVHHVLNVIYVLLALSVVVSFFGIVNTLVLTVYERTRELGMLRAIGMTRRQVRRMIRHESVMTALIGATLGIVLGLLLGGLLAFRVKEIVFAVPWIQLIVFTIAAIVVGIIAAILPARRAAKLNPLEAISYESVRRLEGGGPRLRLGGLRHGSGHARRDVAVEHARDDVLGPELSSAIVSAIAWAAATSISRVIVDARTSSAPRKTPGNASTLLIWLG